MEKNPFDMREVNDTPTPVTVQKRRVPPDRDSTSQFSMEMAEVSPERVVSRQAGRSRMVMKALVFSGVLGAYMSAGYDNSEQQQKVKEDIESVKVASMPKFLSVAKMDAMRHFYPDEEGKEDTEAASHMLEKAAMLSKKHKWQLPVENYIEPSEVVMTEDGRSFEWQGKDYSFGRVTEEDGDTFVVVSRSYQEDNLLSDDRTHAINPILVGGAKAEPGLSEDELREMADEDARKRLEKALKPVRYIRKKVTGEIIMARAD